MMRNYLVYTPARAFHRAFMKKCAMRLLVLCPSKDDDPLRGYPLYYCFLLQLTDEVYNLHIDMVMRRAPSRQDCYP